MACVGGVDTVRGIAYQQAHAVLTALDVLDDLDLGALRVEGADDVVDIELFTTAGTVRHAKQVKVRAEEYTWGEAELVTVLRRWAKLPDAAHASFEFLTDGRLGPTGEKVRAALEDAEQGRRQALADILEENADSAVCMALANARVRIDPVGVGALLLRAEHQVAAMLPQARTAADTREKAERAIGALFRELFDRASDPDAKERIVTREQIAATLGVPADQPASLRWPGGVRDRYLQAARTSPPDALVRSLVIDQARTRSTIRRYDAREDNDPLDVSALLLATGPVMLAGRTGTGKSTAARTLCREAAKTGRVLLLAHAETYLPGRLEALAAEALSGVLGEDLPSATGRQVLADRDVTLIIDGVSEVPAPVRAALHDDLLASVAAGRGAHLIVVGRDVALLREVLPSSVSPASYLMHELDPGRRFDLARQAVLGDRVVEGEQSPDAFDVRTVVAQVEHALGDAAGNPLLFTMGIALVLEGTPFTSRATLYARFVEHLAERSGATGIVIASAALGIVYTGLLDRSRRYADPYEWPRLLAAATTALQVPDPTIDLVAVQNAVRRSGLVNPIGSTQMLAPMHDSFADYFAGVAHARGLSPFPTHLRPGDEQRILFAAEIGGVDSELAALVARDQPFLSVLLADFDRRELTQASPPAEVEALLRYLLPEGAACTVALWRTGDGRVVAIRHDRDQSTWVDESSGRTLLRTGSSIVLQDGGPLMVAVRLWRQDLLARLRVRQALGMSRPRTQEEACSALATHAEEAATATARLIKTIAPPGHAPILAARVGHMGLSATVHAAEKDVLGISWPVSYRPAENIDVVAASARNQTPADRSTLLTYGQSDVNALIRDSPAATAATRVREAITALTRPEWLSA